MQPTQKHRHQEVDNNNNNRKDMNKKYERPDLEELELILEGSFLAHRTIDDGNGGQIDQEGVEIGGEDTGGENWN